MLNIDVNNFENFTIDEYRNNLLLLSADCYGSFVGKEVYYSEPIYGKHKVIKWDINRAEFLLKFDNQRFWSNPFNIINI